jgi:hypothetical protein
MNIDVDVKHPLIDLEQLKYGEHTIVDIAEPRGFRLFGVMEPT